MSTPMSVGKGGLPGYLTPPISSPPFDASNWIAGMIFCLRSASVGCAHAERVLALEAARFGVGARRLSVAHCRRRWRANAGRLRWCREWRKARDEPWRRRPYILIIVTAGVGLRSDQYSLWCGTLCSKHEPTRRRAKSSQEHSTGYRTKQSDESRY
jgi:hypothetical protein